MFLPTPGIAGRLFYRNRVAAIPLAYKEI